MGRPKISTDEWLAELRKIGEKNDEGLSMVEWAAALGVSPEVARKRLNRAKKEGKLLAGKRKTPALDGKNYDQPIYRVVPK